MRKKNIVLLGLFAALAPACAGSDKPGSIDNTPQTREAPLSSTSTFYDVRQDDRTCAFPQCGGYFVRRLNEPLTVCADGSSQAECYVPTIDFAALSPSVVQLDELRDALIHNHAVVRASVQPKEYPPAGNLGQLVASEGWRAATDAGPLGI